MNQNEWSEYLVRTYADTILRLSWSYLKSTEDAQDICQTVVCVKGNLLDQIVPLEEVASVSVGGVVYSVPTK